MKVRENINFERGLDPKKAMGIGFFKYEVEYSEAGFEEVRESDEQLARRWTYKDHRILEVQGSAGQDHISMWVLLSNKKEFSVEANLWRDSKFAYLTIPEEDIKDLDVTEEFFKYLAEDFSALQPVLSVYENYFDEKEAEEEWRRQIEEEESEKELEESVNFERGLDPKESMGIGRTVNILLTGNAGNSAQKDQGFKALILEPVDDPKVNPGKTIFWVKALNGEDEGKNVIVRKFDEPFGKYWGLEWSLALGESQNFERGLDPIRSMDIGMFYFEIEFSGDTEDMEDSERMTAKKWNYQGIKIIYIEGNIDDDSSELFIKLSDGDEIAFKQKSYTGPFRPESPDYAKISIKSLGVKDFEVHDAWVDELSCGSVILATMRMYQDIKEQSLKESQNFERGKDPKDAMGIGNELYRHNLEVLNRTMVDFPWIEDNPEIYASRLTDIGVKLSSINQKTSNFFVFQWVNSRGGQQLRTVNLPKEKWVNLFAAVVGMIKSCETIKEAQEFQRGIDPKAAMRIGIPTWNTLQRGDLLKVLKSIPLDKDNGISQKFAPVSDLPAGVILEVEELDDASSKEWILWFDYYVDINDFKENRGDNVKERHGYIKGIPKQFKKMFEFLPRGMNEAQEFQRGVEPKTTMGIGKKAMIEKWLKEHDLFEDTVLTKDLIINTAKNVQIAIRLKDLGESLPEYIQFGTVFGGFDVQKNKLKTLRGCPQKVMATENYKGNFKCNNNQLTSLEGGPKIVEGNYLCYDNPGKFTQKNIRKVCKVGYAAWGDDPIKIKESMEFQRTGDPLNTMNLGYEAQIKNWFKACGISNDEIETFVDYRINKDGTIDVLEDINLVGAHIENFPYFIRFNKIYGSFYVANNKFTNLDGFPKEVDGDLSIYSDQPGAKKWKEFEVRKKVKVKGTIWN